MNRNVCFCSLCSERRLNSVRCKCSFLPVHAINVHVILAAITGIIILALYLYHDDVIKRKFSALLALCEGNPPVTGHKGQWRGALMYSLICAWTNALANNRDAGDLRRYRAHNDVTVVIESLQLIWGLGTPGFHSRVLDLQISWEEFDIWQNTRYLSY